MTAHTFKPTKRTVLTTRRLKPIDLTVLTCTLWAVPNLAFANFLDKFGTALLSILNNNFVTSIAVVAIIGFGIASLRGIIAWATFLYILLGITFIFGAPRIVAFIQANT